jgi:uncharacterized protein
MTKNCLVIYHANCPDGFAAALAAWLKLKDEADYIPVHYGDEPPDIEDKEVFILDFSFPRDVLLKIQSAAKSIILLDHHKTAQADLECLDFARFDMNKSGAVLAWEYFHPASDIPEFVLHIQDRDLWRWQMDGSREISAALLIEDRTFENWSRFLAADSLDDLKKSGAVILNYQTSQIKKITDSKDIPVVSIAGYDVPCINTTVLISEIGNELAKGWPFAALYFETKDKRVYSLRSAADGIDVSAIAKQFGGGGHFHAAGFTVDKPDIQL